MAAACTGENGRMQPPVGPAAGDPAPPTLAALAKVAGDVSAFYEQHPYPPPVASLDPRSAGRAGPDRRRTDFHLLWPARSFRDDFNILIAGCGTAQAAKYAQRWPRARVTGIDVSAASIRHSAVLKRQHRLENLTLRELSVERTIELGQRFDLIVCTGVLHHLPNPDAGLSALREALEPDGAVHLMVYAPYGRAGVYLVQDYARRLGIGTSPREIRDLVESLFGLPQDHPLVPLLRNAPDFRNDAALADALLHPMDRPYSVPQLLDFLHRGGLCFSRWLRQAAYLPDCGTLASSPHAARLKKLPAEEQYAAAELFRGTMVRHSVVARRDDAPEEAQPIRFDGDDWFGYVPVRLPNTVSVQHRLPPGAACVLINQTHTYTDLILPLDAAGKDLFDAIDGSRSIGDIANGSHARACARTLFPKLWFYDQIVFDASSRRLD
jgi:SAM-dependent methyltransferase